MSNIFENKLMDFLDSHEISFKSSISQEGINLLTSCTVTPGRNYSAPPQHKIVNGTR